MNPIKLYQAWRLKRSLKRLAGLTAQLNNFQRVLAQMPLPDDHSIGMGLTDGGMFICQFPCTGNQIVMPVVEARRFAAGINQICDVYEKGQA